MGMKIRLLFAFILFVLPVVNAQIYRGTIGTYRICLQIESMDETGAAYGNYFYESQCLNIPFEGSLSNDQLIVRAGSRFEDDRNKELFQLRKTGSELAGTWTYQGKQLNVALSEVDPAIIVSRYANNRFVREAPFNSFETIRTSLAQFADLDTTTSNNGIQLGFFQENHMQSPFFVVLHGLPDSTILWVNEQLTYLQLAAFSNYGTCSFGQHDDEDGYHSTLQEYYIDSDFLSMSLLEDYYCGGAHPDFGTKRVNFDLKNHRILAAEDLLQPDGYFERNGHNEDDWFKYREENYAVKVRDYLKGLYPEYFNEEAGNPDGMECDYNDSSVWAFSDLLITDRGFKMGAYFARYIRQCDDPDWAVIPYSVVRELLNPVYAEALLTIERNALSHTKH